MLGLEGGGDFALMGSVLGEEGWRGGNVKMADARCG